MTNRIRINTLPGHDIKIEPAPVKRDWMEATPNRFAYRCLPLNIANSHGWQILCPSGFRVRWNGAQSLGGLAFDYEDMKNPPAISHFTSGIVTFHIPALITTPPGVAMFASGPINQPKHGIAPLAGIIETDWLPFTFTMNWKMTVTGEWIEFKKDEPFCMIYPVRLDDIESYDVDIVPMEDDADLMERHRAYARSRAEFLTKLKSKDEDALKQSWQRDYFQGRDGQDKQDGHRTSLKLAKPVRPSDTDET